MKVLCVFGRHNYGDIARGESYEYANFIPAIAHLGHEVVHFESWDRSAWRDFADLNVSLVRTVLREKPDLIFFALLTFEIWVETLALLRNHTHVRLMYWAADDSWKYAQASRVLASSFDLCATTFPPAAECYRRDGHSNVELTQWAVPEAALAAPLQAVECRHKVSFVGSAYGNRPEWIASLRAAGIHVDCFGHGWDAGPVSAEEVRRIYRESVISLNFSDPGTVLKNSFAHGIRQIKARTFEVTGAGGFLLTEHAPDLDHYYEPGREIAQFNDKAELIFCIRHHLSHPNERDAMAVAGHARTRREHTYEARFSHLFTVVLDKLPARSKPAATSISLEEELINLEARHRTGVALRVLRALIVVPCKMLWGPQRGVRAARKILFELSWRLAGKHTYSASGWPGRMFYAES
jgi:spore maturation protein CgeB